MLSETLTRMWAQVCVMFVYVWQKILFHVMTCVWYIWIWVVFNRAYPRAHIEPHSTSTVNKMYLNISRIALPSVQCETMPSQWKYFTRYKSAIIINRKILSKIHKIHKDCDANSVHYDFQHQFSCGTTTTLALLEMTLCTNVLCEAEKLFVWFVDVCKLTSPIINPSRTRFVIEEAYRLLSEILDRFWVRVAAENSCKKSATYKFFSW